ncbi:carboxypeptidase-like regulatory domain-containing protein [Desertivirga brevis]|uniref:carboxypeptidase-like regulatory domain-containing protein n=1 Tax=Desertivirga brevis TaxID=2810310 RepID=UPI001A97B574|nr:carboxypeptidase-like regulatory domain-containing protein [Pedobacter sp. SYSU D00873]
MKEKISCLLILLLFLMNAVNGQNVETKAGSTNALFSQMFAAVDTFSSRFPQEKIFIHTDRSSYVRGDTLWFKSYLFSRNLGYSKLSGLMYLELIASNNALVKRISVPVFLGVSWGQISLSDGLTEGTYTLRAYTNWMQNQAEESFFRKRIYVSDPAPEHWIVNQSNFIDIVNGKKVIKCSIQFRTASDQPLGYKTIQWKLTDGKKIIVKDEYETVKNNLEITVPLNNDDVVRTLYLEAEEKGGAKQKLNFPLIIKQEKDIDLQFMPESGHLVAGLPCNVAFKAVSFSGKGVDVEGIITNNKNEQVTSFRSSHKGMGVFSLSPIVGESYTASIKLPGGTIKTYPLPVAKVSGTVLQVLNSPRTDSLRVYVLYSESLVNNQTYKLVGFADGQVAYAANFVANKQRIGGKVDKRLFPSGIAHFTLFNEKNEPLNERITFIDHHQQLNIKVLSEKSAVSLRDSVPVDIHVKYPNGKPVQGSFSFVVTDDSQVRSDSLENNILSQVHLGSDLKGYIEDPGWYFNGTEEAESARDLLMLTHGWIGYKWSQILNPASQPVYAAEPDFRVTGKVSNILNKPVANSKLLLLASGKYHFIKDTLTNSAGRFTFRNLPPVDTVSFFVQARTARGKSFNVGLEVDEFKPAAVSKHIEPLVIPWYVNADSISINLVKNREKIAAEQLKGQGGRMLKDVFVTAKRVIKTSKNLNGAGEADQILDEKDALAAGSLNVLQYMEKYVKGFNLRLKDTDKYYYLNEKRVRFVVDGVELNRLYMPSEPPILYDYSNFIENALSNVMTTDLLGVEVMYNQRYASKYSSQFLETKEMMDINNNFAFIEITTRSGNGISIRRTPGVTVYRPLPITWPKEFYQPKYPANSSKLPDYRTTVCWVPNIITDSSGKAKVHFYTTDKKGTYTILLQGADLMGMVGCKVLKIKVGE